MGIGAIASIPMTISFQHGYDSKVRQAQKSYPSAIGLGTVSYQYDVAGHNTSIITWIGKNSIIKYSLDLK